MPNHTFNTLRVDGADSKKALETVVEFMRTDQNEFDFNQVIPYPEDLEKLDQKFRDYVEKYGMEAAFENNIKDGFNQGGYEWRISNWGTKWNAYEVNIEPDAIHFWTAWSPPEPVILALAEKFPEYVFTLEYEVEGFGFPTRHTMIIRPGNDIEEFETPIDQD